MWQRVSTVTVWKGVHTTLFLLLVFVTSCFVLLRDPYIIALRSVSLPTHPPTEGYNRGEVLCAGFTILEAKNNMSLVRQNMILANKAGVHLHVI